MLLCLDFLYDQRRYEPFLQGGSEQEPSLLPGLSLLAVEGFQRNQLYPLL